MKLIILDQTGVINQCSDTFIKTPEEWIPIPGSLEAIARLTHSGYRVVIATNQSSIGRGLIDMTTYNAINDQMYKAIHHVGGRIDAIFFCPHTDADKCTCRKPATGLFDEIMQRYGVNLRNVPVVGDSLKDLQAAAAVGAIPILVLTGHGQVTRNESEIPANTQIFENLAAMAHALIENT
ncbi:MAG: D-glycero-beta-D-manno-heptose 1,7-bisphosphate 7-phosphatase [Nitrosomonas sp.]|uniref:D-glycero-beta-D-manno-heptose 1,7-bisphosphate 7-phosphatase n=1 Tax=Nitrosomonas sp. TaxID=42353 RepID=UPI0025DF06D4|nr:D-glycero-beta-D-manno-heptose 1,7-bisphosphate 7-phosphatase [Nitrosomonas sp.]MBY0473589.1 D-glycero-beta-D-manno-heptose 1,7-bisphosphate 7-phosphatase [Nitrosomonas sp.]